MKKIMITLGLLTLLTGKPVEVWADKPIENHKVGNVEVGIGEEEIIINNNGTPITLDINGSKYQVHEDGVLSRISNYSEALPEYRIRPTAEWDMKVVFSVAFYLMIMSGLVLVILSLIKKKYNIIKK